MDEETRKQRRFGRMNERQTEQTTDQKATERPGDQANELMTN